MMVYLIQNTSMFWKSLVNSLIWVIEIRQIVFIIYVFKTLYLFINKQAYNTCQYYSYCFMQIK